MSDPRKDIPQAKGPAASPSPVPSLIKCRVRPGNTYGSKVAGSVVEVDATELKICAHALIALAEESAQERAAGQAEPREQDRALDAAMARAMESANAHRNIRAAQLAKQLQDLGLEVTLRKAAG